MIDLAALDLRSYLLAALILVAVYLAYSMLPLMRLGRRQRRSTEARADTAYFGLADETVKSADPLATRLEPALGPAAAHAQVFGEGLPGAAPTMFAQELAQSNVELELKRLRREVEQLRAEMNEMAEELRQLKSTRNISPLYHEAMTLAQHGEAAEGIAAQCGISIGEAELVAALARSKREGGFDDRDDDRGKESGH
ncbi:MAG: DUF2802 domain-containing protein [Sulfuritalea sp.]|nr:DUF2802 domain-containing protein [Sulfuritalea sp.]